MVKDTVNWSFDYKKIRILNFLAANKDGAIQYNLQNLPFGPFIKNKEIKIIISELITENLIEQRKLSQKSYYVISSDGRLLITELIKIHKLKIEGFKFLSALDEPTNTDVF